MKFRILTVFARREITTDSATKDLYRAQGRPEAYKRHFDVQIYHDRGATRKFARFPWDYSNCPSRRNRWVTLNCFRWRLQWI